MGTLQPQSTPTIVCGGFNLDVSKPTGTWIESFMLEHFSLKLKATLPKPTIQKRSCIDVTFANDLCLVAMAKPLTVYHSDHNAILCTCNVAGESVYA